MIKFQSGYSNILVILKINREYELHIHFAYHCHLYRCCYVFCLIVESDRTLYNTFQWSDCLHRRNGHQMWCNHCSVSLCCMFAVMFPKVVWLYYRMLVDVYDDGDNNDAMVKYFHLIRVNHTPSLLNPMSHLNPYPKLLNPNDLLCHLKCYPLKMQLTSYQFCSTPNDQQRKPKTEIFYSE